MIKKLILHMFKRVFFLVFPFFSFFFSAQENLNVKVSYVMNLKSVGTYQSTSLPEVECTLYIQNGMSKFNMLYLEAEKKYPGEFYNQNVSVYKDFNKNEMFGRAIGYKNFEYVIKDSLNIIDWKLEESTKLINGKTCKLATAHWRDHDWEAWYDESIPISDGPFKLHGLPGLILEAKATACDGNSYSFTMTEIEFTKDSFEKKIFYPFKNKEFKLIEYDTMYKDKSNTTMNSLKNSYLRARESDGNNIITGRSCSSSITFDFCFCYP